MTYAKYSDSLVQRLNDGAYFDPADATYQAWLAAGHTPIDATAGQPVPLLPSRQIAALDARMVRFAEDLLAALIAKGAVALADLPAATQQLISQRQALRAQIPNE